MSPGRLLKKWWRRGTKNPDSLREFARRLANNGYDAEGQRVAQAWCAAKGIDWSER